MAVEFPFHFGNKEEDADWQRGVSSNLSTYSSPPDSVPFPTIIIHPDPVHQPSIFSINSPFGGMLFSYSMSALFVCFGMLIGWMWKISEPQQVVQADAATSTASRNPL